MSRTFNLLLVDDEPMVHELFKLSLRKEVKKNIFRIFHFNNGKECLDFLEDDIHDIHLMVVLSDINMPVMDGFTLLERLNESHSELDVMIITAYGTLEYAEKAKSLGAIPIWN